MTSTSSSTGSPTARATSSATSSCFAAACGSSSSSAPPRPIRSRRRTTSSPKARRWRIRTGNTRATRSPARSGCCGRIATKDFPATIVRPSLTYDPQLPVAIGGWGCYTFIDRIKRGRPIIVHGDGSSLWVLTHADDFANGFLGLIGNWQAIGHAFHITSRRSAHVEPDLRDDRRSRGRRAASRCTSRRTKSAASRRQMVGTLLGDKTWSVGVRQHEDQDVGSGLPGDDPVSRGRAPHDRGVRGRRAPPPRRRRGEPGNGSTSSPRAVG